MSVLTALRAHSRWRVTAILLCLLACTVQNFVAQTHVHAVGKGSLSTAAGYVVPDDDSGKHNGRSGDTSCPLCQIVLHAGAAPAPAIYVGILTLQAAAFAAADDLVPLGTSIAVSFNWQGRAPPLVG
jgi:hypothetical protein